MNNSNNVYSFKKSNLLSFKAKALLFRKSKIFSYLTTIIILIYSISLSLKSYSSSEYFLNIFKILDYLITLYFVFEISIKIYVEKNKLNFFKDNWNVFDFIIVTISLIPLNIFESIAIARILRVFRVLRLITANDKLKKLLDALFSAIPSMISITILMFIVFYIYAILGNQFFGHLQSGLWNDFGNSMLTLFRILTFEDWTDVMYEAMEFNKYSWIYFVSFVILNAFIIFNLFIAVIVNEVSESRRKGTDILENDHYDRMIIIRKLELLENKIDKIEENTGEKIVKN